MNFQRQLGLLVGAELWLWIGKERGEQPPLSHTQTTTTTTKTTARLANTTAQLDFCANFLLAVPRALSLSLPLCWLIPRPTGADSNHQTTVKASPAGCTEDPETAGKVIRLANRLESQRRRGVDDAATCDFCTRRNKTRAAPHFFAWTMHFQP